MLDTGNPAGNCARKLKFQQQCISLQLPARIGTSHYSQTHLIAAECCACCQLVVSSKGRLVGRRLEGRRLGQGVRIAGRVWQCSFGDVHFCQQIDNITRSSVSMVWSFREGDGKR